MKHVPTTVRGLMEEHTHLRVEGNLGEQLRASPLSRSIDSHARVCAVRGSNGSTINEIRDKYHCKHTGTVT